MKMWCALALVVFFLATIHAGGEESEYIVMVDISASMAPYFGDVVDYLSSDLLRETIRYGDRFHFLSFDSFPDVEISEKITSGDSIEKILTKMNLLRPIGLYTDLVGAIKFLNEFASSLPPAPPKWILLLSDGIHDPPPKVSHIAHPNEVLEQLLREAKILKRNGWNIHILQMPTEGEPLVGPAATAADGQNGQTQTTNESKPDDEEKKSYLEKIASEIGIEVVPYSKDAPLSDTAARIPKSSADASGTIEENTEQSDLQRDNSKRIEQDAARESEGPDERSADTETEQSPEQAFQQSPDQVPDKVPDMAVTTATGAVKLSIAKIVGQIWPFVVLPGGLILMVLLFFVIKNRLAKAGLSDFFALRFDSGGSRNCKYDLIIMKVVGQNSNIGFRNIHCMNPGNRRSIGGGISDFFVFLVPFPAHIADIVFNGNEYVFKPIKKDFFPDLASSVEDCLDADIVARSKRGFQVVMRFEHHISRLDQINNILLAPKHF